MVNPREIDKPRAMKYRRATVDDSRLLAELNHQLIRDEGHRNPMTVPQLDSRMRGWLTGDYTAVIFEDEREALAYALCRDGEEEVYLRQFFVVRHRRRQGIGRRAMEILRHRLWSKDKRLVVEVLWHNQAGMAFWRAIGFREYSLALEILPPRD
jgi:ribosomal protein S18 acetylase RimI-like enzyme